MSGTPRRINTDRSLGTPSAGGGVPPRPPVRAQGGDAPREDDAQSFFRSGPGEESSQLALEKGYPARPDDPGAGAAGGLGFAFRTFLRGELKSGVQVVLEETRLASCIQKADLVVTGEGRLDAQTAMGKAPAGVSGLARSMHKPVIAFSGCVTREAGLCNQFGIDAFFPILRFPQTLEQAMQPREARENLIETVEQVFRLIRTARGLSGC